jgi:hypothetical protein
MDCLPLWLLVRNLPTRARREDNELPTQEFYPAAGQA